MGMTTAQKNRARDNAPRIGEIQRKVESWWITPTLGVIVFFGLLMLVVGVIERMA